jgi:TRAP-type C4-dicarboxylate transport system permease small subunit
MTSDIDFLWLAFLGLSLVTTPGTSFSRRHWKEKEVSALYKNAFAFCSATTLATAIVVVEVDVDLRYYWYLDVQ